VPFGLHATSFGSSGRSSACSLFRRKTSTSSSIDSHHGLIAPQIPAEVKKFRRSPSTVRE